MECVYRLLPTANQYDWGKRGEDSLVYRLFKKYLGADSGNGVNFDTNGPFSELWLGTHQSSPSRVMLPEGSDVTLDSDRQKAEGTNLSRSLAKSSKTAYLSEVLGCFYSELQGEKQRKLKILFKVLSIGKPLSVQMHPDEESAQELFEKKHPGIVDSSAKPEMCVALTKFRAMCGFREAAEVLKFAEKHPEFREALGEEMAGNFNSSDSKSFFLGVLRRLFFTPGLGELVEKLARKLESRGDLDFAEECFLVLYRNYGQENSVFFPFVLNCLELEPGEALFLAPNTMHSYVSGDCVEVMKSSDNVVRTGLTTKFKDVDLCLKLLEKEQKPSGRSLLVAPSKVSRFTVAYEPADPSCNFLVLAVSVGAREGEELVLGKHPHLCVVLESNEEVRFEVVPSKGHGSKKELTSVEEGDCFVFSPETSLKVENRHKSGTFRMYLSSEK